VFTGTATLIGSCMTRCAMTTRAMAVRTHVTCLARCYVCDGDAVQPKCGTSGFMSILGGSPYRTPTRIKRAQGSPVNPKALPVIFHTISAPDIYSRPVAGSLNNHHKKHMRFMHKKGSRPKIPFTSWYSIVPTSPGACWVYLLLTFSSVASQLIAPLLRVEYFRFEH